jgi:glycosyltransferase involved in cell wall biosynthesis
MAKPKITAHMVVKNEDQWIFYSLSSILPYVDQILITDTGSSDHTVEIIKSISSPKIKFSQTNITNANDLTTLRNTQLKQTKTDWVWIIDGDEIYPPNLAQECVTATKTNIFGVVVKRNDLLGDIYHRQIESVGTYNLFGKKGHHLIRIFNKSHFPKLKYVGTYPYEDLVYQNETSLRDTPPSDWYFTNSALYHAMYLKRSSITSSTFNRGKYKIETGISVTTPPPAVFSLPHPSFLPNPLRHRSLVYEVVATIITPIKNLKRKFL